MANEQMRQTFRLEHCLARVVDNRGKTPPLCDAGIELIEVSAIESGRKLPNYDNVKKFVSKETYSTWFRSGHPKAGDTLISTVGAIGRVSFFKEARGCIAQNIVALQPNPELLDGEFLYYYLDSSNTQERLLSLNIGVAQPSLKVPHLLSLEIEIPPLAIQRRIAGILSVYDELIENSQYRIRLLEAMARAAYREALRESSQPAALRSVIDSPYWRFISENVRKYVGRKRYYATADIEGLSVARAGTDYLYADKPSRAQKQPVPNSVWFARMKDTYKIAWYGSLNTQRTSGLVLSSGFAGFEAADSELWPLLFLTISSKEFHVQKDLYCTGATQMSLTNEGLARISMPLPVEQSARWLGRITGPMLNAIAVLQWRSDNLRQTRDLLLSRLLSGQIDVETMLS